MEDKFIRYGKLYFLIFLLFLSVPVIIGLIFALFYGFFKLLPGAPVQIIFEMLIVSIPAAIFTTAYTIFFIRTKRHPSAVVRIISWILFSIGICLSIVVLALDLVAFFHRHGADIGFYRSFSTLFLAGNIASLFLIAILQAFTTRKEKDWMEKRREGK